MGHPKDRNPTTLLSRCVSFSSQYRFYRLRVLWSSTGRGSVGVTLSRRRGYVVVAGVDYKVMFAMPNCDAYSLFFWQS